MQFPIDIPDSLIPSLELFVQTQLRVEPDPETGGPRHTRIYRDVEDLLEQHVTGLAMQIAMQFPTTAVREQLIAKKRAEDNFRDAVQVKIARSR